MTEFVPDSIYRACLSSEERAEGFGEMGESFGEIEKFVGEY